MKHHALYCALLALPAAAFAADKPLPAVVISGTAASPTNATTIDSATLKAQRAATSDTASLLSDVPGVSLYGAGGVSSLPAIHGLADDRLRIKVDGMDLIAACPNHMNSALSYIDPTQVGNLQVYAGIAPVSLGGDSIGGTIIANSPAAMFAPEGQGTLVSGQIGAFYRSNNRARGGNIAAAYATETFSLAYAGATAEADNYTAAGNFHTQAQTGRAGHTLALDEVGSTAFKTENHALTLAMRGGSHLFEAKIGVQDIPYELYPNQRMDMLGNSQSRVNLHYKGQFDWGALEARVYRESVEHFMDFGADKRFWYGSGSGGPTAAFGSPCTPISMTCATGMPMNTDSTNLGVSLKAVIDLSSTDFVRLGSEMQNYRLDDWWPPSGAGMWPGTFWNINNGQRDRAGVFAEWEHRPSAQWVTQLGARYERVSTNADEARGYDPTTNGMGMMLSNQKVDAAAFNVRERSRADNNVDLTALARYTASNTADIELGFARKVRSPNLYERYTWSTWSMAAVMNNYVGDGNGYIGNMDLKPEKAHTLSASFSLHAADRQWAIKATPYYTRVADYVDAIRCPSGAACTPANRTTSNQFVILQYANQSARLYGIDLSGHAAMTKNALGEWGMKAVLNYTNGRNRDSGSGLYNIMPLHAKLVLTQKAAGWDNALEWLGVQAKDTVSTVRNEIRTPGYSLVHLRTSYTWPTVRLDLGMENLLDKFYYLPLGGAYTAQGTTMSTNAIPWGIAVPGMGRTVYAGINVKF
jgi:iron complex outermembrane receptor protein